jgi:Rad9
MQFNVADRNIRIMASAIYMLSKVGRDVIFEASAEGLKLHCHDPYDEYLATAFFRRGQYRGPSACLRRLPSFRLTFSSVTIPFFAEFFTEYHDGELGGSIFCKINAKALTTPFRSVKNVEEVRLWFDHVGAANYMIFQETLKHGVTRTHSLYYQDITGGDKAPFAIFERDTARHMIVARPGLLSKMLDQMKGGAAGGTVATEFFSIVAEPTQCSFKSFHKTTAAMSSALAAGGGSSSSSSSSSASARGGSSMKAAGAGGGAGRRRAGGGAGSSSSSGGDGGALGSSDSHRGPLHSSVAISPSELIAYELSMASRKVKKQFSVVKQTPITDDSGNVTGIETTTEVVEREVDENYGKFDVTIGLKEVLALLSFLEDANVKGDAIAIFYNLPGEYALFSSEVDPSKAEGVRKPFAMDLMIKGPDVSVVAPGDNGTAIPTAAGVNATAGTPASAISGSVGPHPKNPPASAAVAAPSTGGQSSKVLPSGMVVTMNGNGHGHGGGGGSSKAPGLAPVPAFSGHGINNQQHLEKLFGQDAVPVEIKDEEEDERGAGKQVTPAAGGPPAGGKAPAAGGGAKKGSSADVNSGSGANGGGRRTDETEPLGSAGRPQAAAQPAPAAVAVGSKRPRDNSNNGGVSAPHPAVAAASSSSSSSAAALPANHDNDKKKKEKEKEKQRAATIAQRGMSLGYDDEDQADGGEEEEEDGGAAVAAGGAGSVRSHGGRSDHTRYTRGSTRTTTGGNNAYKDYDEEEDDDDDGEEATRRLMAALAASNPRPAGGGQQHAPKNGAAASAAGGGGAGSKGAYKPSVGRMQAGAQLTPQQEEEGSKHGGDSANNGSRMSDDF